MSQATERGELDTIDPAQYVRDTGQLRLACSYVIDDIPSGHKAAIAGEAKELQRQWKRTFGGDPEAINDNVLTEVDGDVCVRVDTTVPFEATDEATIQLALDATDAVCDRLHSTVRTERFVYRQWRDG